MCCCSGALSIERPLHVLPAPARCRRPQRAGGSHVQVDGAANRGAAACSMRCAALASITPHAGEHGARAAGRPGILLWCTNNHTYPPSPPQPHAHIMHTNFLRLRALHPAGLQRTPQVRTPYAIKMTTTALAALLASQHPALQQLQVGSSAHGLYCTVGSAPGQPVVVAALLGLLGCCAWLPATSCGALAALRACPPSLFSVSADCLAWLTPCGAAFVTCR